jgi:hypothetical protein
MTPLLEVLDARTILKGKLIPGMKKEVGHLISEVAEQLCP